MTHPVELHVATLSALFEERLGIRGRSLARQVKKAGRLLPRKVRAEAKRVLHAQLLVQHPRLSRTVKEAEVARSAAFVADHLRLIDPAERRKDLILRSLAKLSALVIAIFILLVWVAWDRGLI